MEIALPRDVSKIEAQLNNRFTDEEQSGQKKLERKKKEDQRPCCCQVRMRECIRVCVCDPKEYDVPYDVYCSSER